MKISRLLVFNPTLSKREEDEHLKVLFYWPPDTSQNAQGTDVGLAEALTAFSSTFSEQTCELVTMEKHVHALYQPEPNFWFVLIAENDSRPRAEQPTELEYDEQSAFEGALRPLVERAYQTCRLFNGSLADVQATRGADALRAALQHTLTPFVAELEVASANVFDALHGVQFLPVEKNVYLRVQSFVNLAEQTFAMIDETAVLYREHLIWSGFDQPTTRILYTLLAHRLRRVAVDATHLLSFDDCPELFANEHGDEGDATASGGDTSVDGAAPLVRGLGDRRLYVWQCEGVICAWLLRRGPGMRALCERLRTFAEPHARFVAPRLAEQYANAYAAPPVALGGSNSSQPHRFIYFNHMNLALKTSLRGRGRTLSRNLMHAISELHRDFADYNSAELMVKTGDDAWLVAKRDDHREFVVIFENAKSANLIEVADEVRRLSSTFFGSIFLAE